MKSRALQSVRPDNTAPGPNGNGKKINIIPRKLAQE